MWQKVSNVAHIVNKLYLNFTRLIKYNQNRLLNCCDKLLFAPSLQFDTPFT